MTFKSSLRAVVGVGALALLLGMLTNAGRASVIYVPPGAAAIAVTPTLQPSPTAVATATPAPTATPQPTPTVIPTYIYTLSKVITTNSRTPQASRDNILSVAADTNTSTGGLLQWCISETGTDDASPIGIITCGGNPVAFTCSNQGDVMDAQIVTGTSNWVTGGTSGNPQPAFTFSTGTKSCMLKVSHSDGLNGAHTLVVAATLIGHFQNLGTQAMTVQ